MEDHPCSRNIFAGASWQCHSEMLELTAPDWQQLHMDHTSVWPGSPLPHHFVWPGGPLPHHFLESLTDGPVVTRVIRFFRVIEVLAPRILTSGLCIAKLAIGKGVSTFFEIAKADPCWFRRVRKHTRGRALCTVSSSLHVRECRPHDHYFHQANLRWACPHNPPLDHAGAGATKTKLRHKLPPRTCPWRQIRIKKQGFCLQTCPNHMFHLENRARGTSLTGRDSDRGVHFFSRRPQAGVRLRCMSGDCGSRRTLVSEKASGVASGHWSIRDTGKSQDTFRVTASRSANERRDPWVQQAQFGPWLIFKEFVWRSTVRP